MRTKDEVDKYIENRLEEWAEWYGNGCDSGLGFQRKNLLQKLREQGGEIIAGSNGQHFSDNPAAEEIESLVKRLAVQSYKQADVLRIRYFNPESHESIAVRKGYSRTRYYSRLKMAHEWIKGYLSARNF